MKRNAIIRIVLWSIALLVLLSVLLTALYVPGALGHIRRESSGEFSGFQNIQGKGFTMDAASVRDLEIEWAAGSIVIQPIDIAEICIAEEGAEQSSNPMVWNVRDRKLSIQYCKDPERVFVFGMDPELESKDLIIQVPLDWQCNTLEIEAATAKVNIRDLAIREVDFDGASGTCEFESCSVDKLDVDTASGDIRFSGSLITLDCDAASASVYAVLTNVPSRLDMDSMSGDLDITLPADAGFTLRMDALSSNVQSDFETTTKNETLVAGDGHCRIEVDAMSGDVIIRKAS